jgi:hypothetical protein
MTRLVKGYNMRKRTGTKINFRESYDELTLVFWPSLRNISSYKFLKLYVDRMWEMECNMKIRNEKMGF